MAITYQFVGHATHLFEVDGTRILVDPFFTSNPQTELDPGQVECAAILLTHGHFDHVEDCVAIARRTGCKVVANFEIANWLQAQGLPEAQTHAQHIGGGFRHDFGHVKLTIAHHGSSLPDGSYGGQAAGLLLALADRRIYVTGDTALFGDMRLYAGVDLMTACIGDNFTMGPDDALEAVRLVAPKRVVPCHYGTFPPIEQDADGWARRVEAEVAGTAATVLRPGESLSL